MVKPAENRRGDAPPTFKAGLYGIAVGGIGEAGRDCTPTFNPGLYGMVVGGIGEAGRDYAVQHAL